MNSPLFRAWLFCVCLLCSLASRAQDKKISGTVISEEDSKPIPGITVTVRGKNQSTQTGTDGQFTISTSVGNVLEFTSVGFVTQQVTVVNETVIRVTLKSDAAKLGEVVVVGYGTQSRKNVTTSISKIDMAVLANTPRSNVGTALQGTLPGIQVVNSSGAPGAAPLIILRGNANINNPSGPLVVVDGIIRPFNDIPSEDIASIELLKDAAASAIYGARANNGVILITTKQGKSGAAQISYKFTGGYNKRREGYKYMNAKDFIYYNRLGNLNSGRTLAQVNATRGYGLLTDPANLATFDIRAFDASTAGLLQKGWDTVGDPYAPGSSIIFKDHSGEVENLVFRNTYTQDHYVNVVGGNDKGNYFASFDYYKEDGIIVGSGYKRFSGNVNGSYKVKPNLEVTTGVNFSTSSQLGAVTSDVNTLYRSLALWPTFNPWLDSAKILPNPGNSISDGNPLYWLQKVQRSNEVNRFTANASIKYDILPGLYIKATGNAYLVETINQSFNLATQTYANVFATPPSYSSTSRDAIAAFSRTFQQQYNAVINYSKTFNAKHHLSAMLGAEFFGTKVLNMQVDGTNAPTDNIPTANASTTFAAVNNFSNRSEFRIISDFGRLNYDYDQKYLLTVVYRQDGASSLGTNNRFGFFPGMSAGWNVNREKFYENSGISNVISSFKPRVSYGVNGNIAGIGNYDVQGVYASQGNYNGNLGFLNTGIINSDLRWEKSKTTDFGADVGILKNRISFLFDYFNRKTSDLLTDLTLPSYIGFSSVRTNLGTLQNKGYEFSINASIIRKPNGFSWDVSANVSYIKNKILQLPYNGNDKNRQGGLQIYDPKQGKVVWVGGLQEGQSIGDIYGFKQVSIFKDAAEVAKTAGNRYDAVANISGPNLSSGTGKITPGDVNWLDVDKNDTIDSRDQVYLGNYNPKYTGGFSTTLSYKGFSFFTRFEYALGHTIYNDLVARTLGNFQGTFNYIDEQKNAWTPTNTNTNIPKVYYADQVAAPVGKKNYTRVNNASIVLNGNNSQFYEKGDYLACREITLSYDFPKSILTKARILSQARIYASLNNLFYVTKFTGPTPEPPVSTGVLTNGVLGNGVLTGNYIGTYPTPKSIVLGVQVSF